MAVQSQAACAVEFARAHAAEYGGDPATMIVFGHSGGSHAAAMVTFARPAPTADCLGGATLGPIDALVTWEGNWLLSANEPDWNGALTYHLRGIARWRAGDETGALADYDRAIELDPEYAEPYASRGHAEMAAGDCAAALTDAEKAIELKPKLAYSYVVRALCRADSEDLGAAWEDANTAIELGGPDFVAYYTRGYVAAEKGDRLNAKLDFGEAIDLAPSEEMVEEVRSLAEEYDIPLD